ncbi:YueI family protein [Limosilactobacillus kribbianus]|uniref:YueI family protein n=1 Tax=Limosilactobacillus kribbianus TaxID=2982695 RepID=UPI002263D3E7|nr:YueI family protein [Limosilactobacillus kribbianus]
MTESEKSLTRQHIDNAIYGTPKIKPDEQRKYLGTFRERVCLTISVQELRTQNWQVALVEELNRGIGNLVFLNGNLPHEEIHPYLLATNQNGGIFTMKTDPEFKTDPDSLAVVVAAKTAVYQSPVDVAKRYPQLVAKESSSATTATPKHGFFYRLFHGKEEG